MIKFVIFIGIFVVIVINYGAYWCYRKHYRKQPLFEIDEETKAETERVTLIVNYSLKWSTIPLLSFMALLMTIIMVDDIKHDIKIYTILQNPISAEAIIFNKYKKQKLFKTDYVIEYFINDGSISPDEGYGCGNVSDTLFNQIYDKSTIITTYNKNKPSVSVIGNYLNIPIESFIQSRLKGYSLLLGVFFINLSALYYFIFKIRIHKKA
jgi:hypothetical protein